MEVLPSLANFKKFIMRIILVGAIAISIMFLLFITKQTLHIYLPNHYYITEGNNEDYYIISPKEYNPEFDSLASLESYNISGSCVVGKSLYGYFILDTANNRLDGELSKDSFNKKLRIITKGADVKLKPPRAWDNIVNFIFK